LSRPDTVAEKLSEVNEGLDNVTRKFDVVWKAILVVRADQNRLDNRPDKLESR
jgi:hypothetical protein